MTDHTHYTKVDLPPALMVYCTACRKFSLRNESPLSMAPEHVFDEFGMEVTGTCTGDLQLAYDQLVVVEHITKALGIGCALVHDKTGTVTTIYDPDGPQEPPEPQEPDVTMPSLS